MSAGAGSIDRTEALAIAAEIIEAFAGTYHEIDIVGSVRRGRCFVGDVELVHRPIVEYSQTDLFGGAGGKVVSLFRKRADELMQKGLLMPRLDKNQRPRWGEAMQWAFYKRIPVDLFGVIEPSQYGLQKVIRTGPEDFSHKLVTSRLEGGYLPPGMKVRHGGIYEAGVTLLPTPTEEGVFRILGIPFVEPGDREEYAGGARLANRNVT